MILKIIGATATALAIGIVVVFFRWRIGVPLLPTQKSTYSPKILSGVSVVSVVVLFLIMFTEVSGLIIAVALGLLGIATTLALRITQKQE